MDNSIVDTHFTHRGGFGRLAHAVLKHPELYGLGLGEDTALLIENGNATCKGSGMVIVISAKNVTLTNEVSTDKNSPIYAENLKVNILTDNCILDLSKDLMTKTPSINQK